MEYLKQNPPDDYYSVYFIRDEVRLGADFLADFRLAFTLVSSDYSFLLEQRVLQMVDAERVRFKRKLARFYGRPTEEELQAGLWAEK